MQLLYRNYSKQDLCVVLVDLYTLDLPLAVTHNCILNKVSIEPIHLSIGFH